MGKPREFLISGSLSEVKLYETTNGSHSRILGIDSKTKLIEKSAADKLADALEKYSNQKTIGGMFVGDYIGPELAIKALKEYRGK